MLFQQIEGGAEVGGADGVEAVVDPALGALVEAHWLIEKCLQVREGNLPLSSGKHVLLL